MKQNLFQYTKLALSHFVEAIVNILIFLPYFFSVANLFKTLFSPWKSLTSKKTTLGFSFDEWLNRFFYNTISRGIGFIMRLSIILFYLLFQIAYIILLPIFFISYILLIPILYLEYLIQELEQNKKERLKKIFMQTRCLKEENKPYVELWFNSYYELNIKKISWWKISALFSTPPIARDWSVGYTPTVDEYATDLLHINYQKQKKHIVGRQKETKLIEQALSKTDEANVIIVGEEGVGKHTVIDSLAKKIYEGNISSILMYKRILKLDMEKVLTQYTDLKQRENFFDELLSEAAQSKSVILMIENIDRYLSYGEGHIDLTSSIEKYGKSALIQIIGTTTPFLFEKIIAPNEKINRIFTKINVNEPTDQEAISILFNILPTYEYIHKVLVPYETIKTIIEKSGFYITYIPYPEKAIELLESCCIYTSAKPKIKNIIPVVMPEDVDLVLSEKTHIPTSLTTSIKEKLIDLENLLEKQIIQQPEAIKVVATSLRRSFILMGKRKKPIASFLFLGPTGVGKTQTAKAIAQVFFSDSTNFNEFQPISTSFNHLIRFDMSLYQSRSDIPKLIGSMENNNPGLLTATIRENPYGVLLLDEIEKADKELLNIFLTILDEGYFTDGFGKKIDCKNLVVVATSNAGEDYEKIFLPEFLNRFDGVVIFKPLSQNAIIQIARTIIDQVSGDIYKLHKVKLQVSNEYISIIAQSGYDPKFGARNMERLIRDEIEDKVAKMILENKVKENDVISL
jgi:ATP-dependent Clp protease ATP-binding subunit ClpC